MKNTKSLFLGFLLASSVLLTGAAKAQKPVIRIQADETVAKINPLFYGLMTEEINYSYDGGLYAELIRNRAFKDNAATPDHWSVVTEGEAKGSIALDSIPQPGTALTRNLRLDIEANEKGRAGAANSGYWGIPVKPNTTYQASFYAKTGNGFGGTLTLSLESNDGKILAKATVKATGKEWKKYNVTLKTGKMTESLNNRFVISAQQKGTVWLSLVSLFPPIYKNRPNGNRPDLMEMLAEMKPAFLRFPGGNYLQGKSLATRFDWKQTVGDLTQRPTHLNDAWKYHSSDGMGLIEFMHWCEDLKMEPVLGVFAGFMLLDKNPMTGDTLKPYIDDALNQIEYLTGDATTHWGAKRIKDGHPEAFKINYVEVGNEDFFDKKRTYDHRFAAFYDAIKARYPHIKVIASDHVKSRPADLTDLHHYFKLEKAIKLAHAYDNYDRKRGKVFIGEYACREGKPTTNFKAALGDAIFLTGLERNADLVEMTCYAPLFVNVNKGGMQWPSNLIGYNGLGCYGSPSYYMQTVFAKNVGDEVVKSSIENIPMSADTTEQLFYSVTKSSQNGTLYLKVVNLSDKVQTVQIDINSAGKVLPQAEMTLLTAEKRDDTNTIAEPKKITPKSMKISVSGNTFDYEFKPNSITVLKINQTK